MKKYQVLSEIFYLFIYFRVVERLNVLRYQKKLLLEGGCSYRFHYRLQKYAGRSRPSSYVYSETCIRESPLRQTLNSKG